MSSFTNIVNKLLEGHKGADLERALRVDGIGPVAEEFERARGRVKALERHVRRSPVIVLKEYASKLISAFDAYDCIDPLSWNILEKHSRHAEALYVSLQEGRASHEHMRFLLEMFERDLIRVQLPTGSTNRIFEAEAESKEHDVFVRKLEKKFKVKAHRWEPVVDGVILFFNREEHEKLLAEFSYREHTDAFLSEVNYLLLRKGRDNDIAFGAFGGGFAKWTFIKVEKSVKAWVADNDEGISYTSSHSLRRELEDEK